MAVKLAIHHSNAGFHPRWVGYCEEQGIPFKRVDCHASDIIQQLSDCNGLLWHHSQMNPRDLLVAKAQPAWLWGILKERWREVSII